MIDPNLRPNMPYFETRKNMMGLHASPLEETRRNIVGLHPSPLEEIRRNIVGLHPSPLEEIRRNIVGLHPSLLEERRRNMVSLLEERRRNMVGLHASPLEEIRRNMVSLHASPLEEIRRNMVSLHASPLEEIRKNMVGLHPSLLEKFSAISANLKALTVSNKIFLQEHFSFAKSFFSFTDTQDIAKLLQSNVSLYRVKTDSLLNYLKHPIFDIYNLNSEVILNSFEDDDLTNFITQEDKELSETEDSSQLIIILPFKSIIEKVKHENLDNLHWREFEKLISELLEKEGWNVKLLEGTKDGGADIIGTKEDEHIGLIKCVWQAKKYKITNKVKLPAIRELADVRNEFGASKAILVTTSFLTRGAKDRIQRDQHILAKKERKEVECWINKFTN
jgi:HJR/Mrr/RecB family endonuclease